MSKTPFRTLYIARKEDQSDFERVFGPLFDATVVAEDYFLSYLMPFDVILFGGGTDINPSLYGETRHPLTDESDIVRDNEERKLFRRAQAAGAACIGVCRGAQLLCALSGGKLIQHVSNHRNNPHPICTDDGQTFLAVADHHQLMYPYDTFYHLLAWGPGIAESHCEYGKTYQTDKEPEVVWFPDTRCLSIQPHPEWMNQDLPFPEYCRELVKKLIFGSEQHHAH